MKVTQLSSETLDRAHERFEETLAQMTVAEANTMPAPLIKSVTWLMWHTARDLQISALNHSEPLWLSQHWTEKFALDLPDETEDWHHTPEEAAKVVVAEKQLLSDYLAASVALTKSYLDQIKEEQLSDVIDKMDPPVTRQVRLVSAIDDAVILGKPFIHED